MPIYRVAAPNGKTYRVEGPEGATQEQLAEQVLLHDPSAGSPPEQEGFFSSIGRAATVLKELPASLGYGVAGTPEEEAARRKQLLEAARPEGATTSFEDVISGPGKFTDWVKQLAGGSLGYLAAPAVGATASALLKAPTPVTKGVGAGILGLQYLAENLQRQAQERGKAEAEGRPVEMPSIPMAGAAAAGQTALDVAGFKYFAPLFSRFPLLKNLVGEAGEKAARESTELLVKAAANKTLTYTGGIAKGFAKGVAFEIPQEVAQQALERWQAGADLFDEDARREYLEAAAGAAVLGGPMGAVSGTLDVASAKSQLAEKAAAEEAAKAAAEAPPEASPKAPSQAAEAPPAAEAAPQRERKEVAEPEDPLDKTIFNTLFSGYRSEDIFAQLDPEQQAELAQRATQTNETPDKYIRRILDEAGYDSAKRQALYASREFKEAKTRGEARGEADTGAGGRGASVPVPGGPAAESGPAAVGAGPVGGVVPAAGVPVGRTEDIYTALADVEAQAAADAQAAAEAQRVKAEADAQAAEKARVKAESKRLADERARAKKEAAAAVESAKTGTATKLAELGVTDANLLKLKDLDLTTQRGFQQAYALLETVRKAAAKTNDAAALGQVADVQDYLSELAPPTRTPEQEAVAAEVKKLDAQHQTDLQALRDAGANRGLIDEVINQQKEERKISLAALVKQYGLGRQGERGGYEAFLKAQEPKKARTAEEIRQYINELIGDAKATSRLKEPVGERIAREKTELSESERAAQARARRQIAQEKRGVPSTGLVEALRSAASQAQGGVNALLGYLKESATGLKTSEAGGVEIDRKGDIGAAIDAASDLYRKWAKGPRDSRLSPTDYKRAIKESTQRSDAEVDDLYRQLIANGVLLPTVDGAGVRFKPSAAAFIKADYSLFDISSAIASRAGKSALYRRLADSLGKVAYDTKIVLEESNDPQYAEVFNKLRQDEAFGAYDPRTDTIFITDIGTNEETLLHELVHAATTKLIRQFLTDPSKLTPTQREAIEHLSKIMELAKKRLGDRYTEPFTSLYEFVGYAMTDQNFQADLAKLRSPALALYTKGMFEDLWSNFTAAIAKLFKLFTDKGFIPRGRTEAIQSALLTATERKEKAQKKAVAELDAKWGKENIYRLAQLMDPAAVSDKEAMQQAVNEVYATLLDTDTGKDIKSLDELEYVYSQKIADALSQREYGYEGNLALEAAEAFENIIAAPERIPEFKAPLPARGAKAAVAPQVTPDEQYIEAVTPKKLDELSKPSFDFYRGLKHLWSQEGFEKITTLFQNDRAPLKFLQTGIERAGKLVVGVNDIFNQLSAMSGRAEHNKKAYVDPYIDRMNEGIEGFRKAREAEMKKTDPKAKYSVNEAMQYLSRLLEAMSEPEKRHQKYLRYVPLTDAAHARRLDIYKELAQNKKLSKNEIDALRTELEQLVQNNRDENGQSELRQSRAAMSINEDAKTYRVLGALDPVVLQRFRNEFAQLTSSGSPYASNIANIRKAIKELQESTIKLDSGANYWSNATSNIKAFYDYQYYVPFKGKPESKTNENDGALDYDFSNGPKKYGRDFNQPILGTATGRESDTDNVLLQTQIDATTAAMREARAGAARAVRSLLGEERVNLARQQIEAGTKTKVDLTKMTKGERGLMDGTLLGVIKFEDRFKPNYDVPTIAKGKNVVFNYMDDGTIEVYEIHRNDYAEAIRKTWMPPNFFVDKLNALTSGIAQFHTRYNVAFPVMDFVRNMLTNAPMLGAKFGGKYATDYINAVAKIVGTNGLWKAGRVEYYYSRNDLAAIEAMAKKDPFVRDIVEFFEAGGRVTYIQGIALQGKIDSLIKDVNKGKPKQVKEAIDKVVDVWMNSFEMTSRVAAYKVVKEAYKQKNPAATEEQAQAYAAAEAKNLANFEQVGTWGKELGAFFMFFRPAATGAVRAIDALMPALVSVDQAIARLPEKIRNDPEALETFKKNYESEAKNARLMVGVAAGVGAMVYLMALSMSGDDDMNRNKVAKDEMPRWQRYARIPLDFLPGGGDKYGNFLQIPWGFGVGAFAAMGAQMMAAATGNQTIGAALHSSGLIAMDSFLPIPVSRMDWTDSPAVALVDTLMPSAIRPLVEFTMNKDSLGREIYNSRQTPYGSAYVGSDNVPEAYKGLARWMSDTLGVEASPNVYYFFANNYLDGISRLGHNFANLGMTLAGRKDFDPKTDLVIFDSYFGRKSNVDAREYAEAEKQIKKMGAMLSSRENADPDAYVRYLEENPFAEYLVELYNKNEGGDLKGLRSDAKLIRSLPNSVMSPKEKKEILDMINLQQNYIKRAFVDAVKDFGVTP